MPEQNQINHDPNYPEGDIPPLLAYAFRPFFILLPAYIALSILLWGLAWSGQINLFMDDILTWHIYEMIFGVASAGIVGFILTGVPEFYAGVKPVVGKTLLAIVTLWVIGRLAFWMIDWLGVVFVALTNLPLLIWVIALIAKPIFSDPLRKNVSLGVIFITIFLIQG